MLAGRVLAAIAAKPDLVLGLPAGRTPVLIYRTLVAESRARGVDWSRVRTFNIDEFVTEPAAGRQPFEEFMHEHLLKHVNVQPQHADRPDGRAKDLDAECDRYERAIASAGGLDLLLLGIGTNGHVGFNEPGGSFLARTHRAVLAESSREANAHLFGGRTSSVPATALTMGLTSMVESRAMVLVATGDAKSAAIAAMLEQPMTHDVPASFLQQHPTITVMVDEAAAAGIFTEPAPAAEPMPFQ